MLAAHVQATYGGVSVCVCVCLCVCLCVCVHAPVHSEVLREKQRSSGSRGCVVDLCPKSEDLLVCLSLCALLVAWLGQAVIF